MRQTETDDKIQEKQAILIVDDSEMNRAILTDMLQEDYRTLEAENGVQAVELIRKYSDAIDLVLLDITMPEMDGFEVLAIMNKYHLIDNIPVIMISAERASSYMERAYELGVTDYISRPFDALIVRRRVENTLMLYAKQKRLVGLVADQVYEKERNNSMMVNILSHIVEFRNGESGLHVLHINTMTEILLQHLVEKTDKYPLTQEDIIRISTASALHDIGKISIPDEIINKSGRLTKEEFEIMKTHSAVGASMLSAITAYQNEPFMKTAYEICRWHHERYDGKGYPDGLKGDEIPISAQIVSLADVYDALTSERCYKKAFSHETAINMIMNGECGAFNPLLLDCLLEVAGDIQRELAVNSPEREFQVHETVEQILKHKKLHGYGYSINQMRIEQAKKEFFFEHERTLVFDCSELTNVILFSNWGRRLLGLKKNQLDLRKESSLLQDQNTLEQIRAELAKTTPENPSIDLKIEIHAFGEMKEHRLVARTLWSDGEEALRVGVIGRAEEVFQLDERR